MHPIADFLTPYRRIDTSKWWTPFVSEWILAINPLHGIWDKWSPLRRHQNHATPNLVLHYYGDYKNLQSGFTRQEGGEFVAVDWWFWRWLAIDQLYHVLTNALVALLLGLYL